MVHIHIDSEVIRSREGPLLINESKQLTYTIGIKLSIHILQNSQVKLQEKRYINVYIIYFYFDANCSPIAYQLNRANLILKIAF